MAVSENGENPTNGIGNWQKATVSDLKVWQQYYRDLGTPERMNFPSRHSRNHQRRTFCWH